MADRFLGCFPYAPSPDNPEVYLAELCVLLGQYPAWCGQQVLDEAKYRFKFPPTLAELKPMLGDAVRARRYVAEWERGARELAEERARLASPAQPTGDELKARYGPRWGIRDPDREAFADPFMTVQDLERRFGKEVVAAVPDLPDGFWRRVAR
jgi:hypothetical protein